MKKFINLLLAFSFATIATISLPAQASLSTPESLAVVHKLKKVSKENTGVRIQKRLDKHYDHLKYPDDLAFWVRKAADHYKVDAKLLLSMCVTESHLRATVRSKHGAEGLCQIRPTSWGYKKGSLMDYRVNVFESARILSEYTKLTGSKFNAVHAYNVGYTAWKKGKRSHSYYRKVMREYRRA